GVGEVFPLEEDARAARRRRQPPRLGDWGRPADVLREQAIDFGAKAGVVARREIGALELLDRLDQRLGHVAPAKLPEVAADVRIAPGCHGVPRTARARADDL